MLIRQRYPFDLSFVTQKVPSTSWRLEHLLGAIHKTVNAAVTIQQKTPVSVT